MKRKRGGFNETLVEKVESPPLNEGGEQGGGGEEEENNEIGDMFLNESLVSSHDPTAPVAINNANTLGPTSRAASTEPAIGGNAHGNAALHSNSTQETMEVDNIGSVDHLVQMDSMNIGVNMEDDLGQIDMDSLGSYHNQLPLGTTGGGAGSGTGSGGNTVGGNVGSAGENRGEGNSAAGGQGDGSGNAKGLGLLKKKRKGSDEEEGGEMEDGEGGDGAVDDDDDGAAGGVKAKRQKVNRLLPAYMDDAEQENEDGNDNEEENEEEEENETENATENDEEENEENEEENEEHEANESDDDDDDEEKPNKVKKIGGRLSKSSGKVTAKGAKGSKSTKGTKGGRGKTLDTKKRNKRQKEDEDEDDDEEEDSESEDDAERAGRDENENKDEDEDPAQSMGTDTEGNNIIKKEGLENSAGASANNEANKKENLDGSAQPGDSASGDNQKRRVKIQDPNKEEDEDEDEEDEEDEEDDEKGEKQAQDASNELAQKNNHASQEEAQGIIKFQVITNDGTTDSLMFLTGAKNIFQKQLPKMPKEYITRLVYDRKHKTMVIVKENNKVIGAITYRPFDHKCFAEIVFCAIHSENQVRGYGSSLMSHLKDYITTNSNIKYFLTYADNYAVGYFKKQGFSTDISLDKNQWVGYIKDYDGGTLMQCSIIPKVTYLKVKELIQQQRHAVVEKIKAYSSSHVVRPGLKVFKEGQTFISVESIPFLLEAGWTLDMSRSKRGAQSNLNSSLLHYLTSLKKHSQSWPFREPVSKEEVADYYDIIKDPMDFKTIEERLTNKYYKSLETFVEDVNKIFNNCRLYNEKDTPYVKCANTLEAYFKDLLAKNPKSL